MIPFSALAGVFEHSGIMQHVWQGIAWCASAVAMWAHTRAASRPIDPVDDLMQRVRHPVRWTARHPIVAVKRKLDRRKDMR